MKYKVKILPSAWEDLKKIEDFYEIQFNAEVAIRVSSHILNCLERLEDYPNSGSMTPDKWLNEQGYKMLICKKHVAIYRVIDKSVFIYHIADTRTDYTKLFY